VIELPVFPEEDRQIVDFDRPLRLLPRRRRRGGSASSTAAFLASDPVRPGETQHRQSQYEYSWHPSRHTHLLFPNKQWAESRQKDRTPPAGARWRGRTGRRERPACACYISSVFAATRTVSSTPGSCSGSETHPRSPCRGIPSRRRWDPAPASTCGAPTRTAS
jgi:hypothetical protein